jgi:hypothetical protein
MLNMMIGAVAQNMRSYLIKMTRLLVAPAPCTAYTVLTWYRVSSSQCGLTVSKSEAILHTVSLSPDYSRYRLCTVQCPNS